MIRLGLTGSIGMGKSTAARMFAEAGVPVFDADAEVRRLQGRGGALVAAIERRFPGSVRDGAVDREALSALVLGKPGELAALEAIVHPAVARERERFAAAHRDSPAVLFEIPLLFETGADRQVDKVIVVSAPPEIQRQRVLSRPGMTPEKLDAILTRQTPDEEKRSRADFIIDSSGPLDATKRQVEHILACLGLAVGQ